ncbi:MAG TPA: PEGA domain-containing protein [Kofleriaceae bacterium]|nr:PEGA domain-containing protein [Kofleriaceae bacterium]
MPRLRLFSRLSLAVLLLAALGSVAWAKPKVAVLGLEASNSGVVEPKDAANAAKLTEELRALPRSSTGKYDLAPNSNRELQDEKLMGNCDTEKPACMAPIGAGLGADFLVYGNIVKAAEKGKDGYKVNLKLLNVKTKVLEEQEEAFVPLAALTGGNGAKDWAQKIYGKLTGEKPAAPDRPAEAGPGKLVIKSNVKSGDVFIGSAKKGTLEGGTVTLTLPEGSHKLAIESPGHQRYETTVTVAGGQTKNVEASLEELLGPSTQPPPATGKSNRTVFKIAGYGLGGVGVASAIWVLYETTLGPIAKYESRSEGAPVNSDGMEVNASSGDCDSTVGKDLRTSANLANSANRAFDDACRANTRRFVVGAVGVASGVLALGALYFAYRSDGKSTEAQAMGRRTRRQLTVTPVISPTGGGATVRFDW